MEIKLFWEIVNFITFSQAYITLLNFYQERYRSIKKSEKQKSTVSIFFSLFILYRVKQNFRHQ